MSGYKTNIERKTLDNKKFRKILYTTKQMQLVVMSVIDDIPKEKHVGVTQFIRVESGKGYVIIGNKKRKIEDGDCVIIPENVYHYVKNTDKNNPLKLYVLYAPPEH